MLSDDEAVAENHEFSLANYRTAAAASVLALARHGIVPEPPPKVPVPHVVGDPQPDPLHLLMTPWQQRIVTPEPSADAAEARTRLGAGIAERSTAATALGLAEDALGRADQLIADISSDIEDQAERAESRATNLADRIRAWIAAGSVGERPMAGLPEAPTRTESELAGAHVARLAIAAEVAAASDAHTRAVSAVDHHRRMVLAAEGQALAAEIDAAEAALAELRTEAFALLNVNVGGLPVYHGTLKNRITAEPPQSRDLAPIAARFGDYAARLNDDADAQL